MESPLVGLLGQGVEGEPGVDEGAQVLLPGRRRDLGVPGVGKVQAVEDLEGERHCD